MKKIDSSVLKHATRYYEIDFKHFHFSIIKNKWKGDLGMSVLNVPFREILKVNDTDIDLNANLVGMGSFTFPLHLKTSYRFYQLYAESATEKKIWMAAFNYII